MDDGRAPRLFGKGRSWFVAAEGGWGKWRGLSTAGKHAAPGSTEGSRCDSAHTLSRLFRHRRKCGHAGKQRVGEEACCSRMHACGSGTYPHPSPWKTGENEGMHALHRPGTPKLPLRRLRTSSPRYRSHPRLRAASPFDKPAYLVGRLGGAERAREEARGESRARGSRVPGG